MIRASGRTFFTTAELSANVCVAHGTLCNEPGFYVLLQQHRTVIATLVPGKFGLFRRNL